MKRNPILINADVLMTLLGNLNGSIEKEKLRFALKETPVGFANQDMRRIELSTTNWEATIYVDDEYNDVDTASPPLLLNMVLMEFTWYTEEEDFLTWCTSKNLDPGNNQVLAYYKELGKIATHLKTLLPTIEHTSFFDWQLNAGEAQILRNL